MESTVVFRAAALVLSYPDEELIGNLDAIEEAVAATSVADLFAPTIAHLRSGDLMEVQASHVQEFDLSRRHALHLTYWTDGDTSFVDSLVAPFSVANALIVSVGMRKKSEIKTSFDQLEKIWKEYRIYEDK